MDFPMETVGFTATFGTNPGYNHNNENEFTLDRFGRLWQKHMQDVFDKKDLLVGCVFYPSRTVYPVGFGCPIGGEHTITVTGHYNPNFRPTDSTFGEWINSLAAATVEICGRMKQDLKQTTVSISFHKIESFVYLNK